MLKVFWIILLKITENISGFELAIIAIYKKWRGYGKKQNYKYYTNGFYSTW